MTVPEIFEQQGEQAFRQQEAAVLARACAEANPTVISVAGGAILSAANRELLRASGTVCWLRARPETLAARVGDGAGRPLLDHDPARVLATLNTARASLYEEVADVIIDVDELSPAEVSAIVLKKAAA
jgi:shikimate kinase